MNIGIVGSNGFVGSSLQNYLQSKYNVIGITRQTVNVLNSEQLNQYLEQNKFDVIIICAATMNNNIEDVHNNLGLVLNFYNHRHLFGKLINTASGAEYDRDRGINLAKEIEIFSSYPKDFYGLGQNLRSRLCYGTDNFYNLRIFNCFGLNEIKTRLFPRFLNCAGQFTVYDDRYFDYFSIQDLCLVVEYFITQNPTLKDINCVYSKKYLISEVITMFNKAHSLNKTINVESKSDKNYTGCSANIDKLNLPLNGLQHGLINYFSPNCFK